MTERQKQIYNQYLRAYRQGNNVPFRPKRDFTGFEDKPDYLHILKLDKFFERYPHLFKQDFFDAPYKLYNDEKKFYSLAYYASYKGLTTCIEFYKHIQNANPDEHTDFIKDSLKFVANFCIDHNISLDHYPSYKSVAQCDFLKHLKEHRISWYVIFGFPNAINTLNQMAHDEFELYFGYDINLSSLQIKYSTSKHAKKLVENGIKKLKNFVENKMQKV